MRIREIPLRKDFETNMPEEIEEKSENEMEKNEGISHDRPIHMDPE